MPSFRVAFRRLFLLRLVGTVSLRFAYPFLPMIADGLDAGIGAVGVGVACGEVAGFVVPFVGRRLDRIGRRRGMEHGLVICSAGCLVVSAAPSVAGFGIGMFVVAIGRYFFDVSFGAWIGDEVEFATRGRASGIGELAWSGAFLIGVPIAGLIASVTSWRVPYALSAVFLLGSLPVVRRTLSTREARSRSHVYSEGRARVTGIHIGIFALSLGAALLFVTEGAWFEADLGFSERTISLVVILLGVGEVIGALLSAFFADRLGKRLTILAGLVVLAPAAGAFALVGTAEVAGVLAALVVGLGFELAFVSAIPLVVEVAEDRRAGALGLAVAALTAGRTVAAVIGTRLFDASGIDLVVVVSVPSVVVAFGVVAALVREPASPRAAA